MELCSTNLYILFSSSKSLPYLILEGLFANRNLSNIFLFITFRIEEAEAQCALLNSESLCVSSLLFLIICITFMLFLPFINAILKNCHKHDNYDEQDGCFSLDSDIFLFGARTVYRDICLGE